MAEPTNTYIETRNALLKNIPPATIRKAWFALSHLLLDDGAHVIDMGCDDGTMTYIMAVMAPNIHFTGLDKAKRQINKAKEKYKLPNLDFKIGDASSDIFDPQSIDAIVNSYVLHEIFSSAQYNESAITQTLATHFKALKTGGVMFICDYARPPPEEFVLLEMPDEDSTGDALAQLSFADLLIWYSEHARPKQDAGCGGFFLEELLERVPDTRLFRLPYKWAYEFIMRKDDRSHWQSALPMEYTFFTMHEFRKNLQNLGARVQYSGPYFDDDIISEKFEGRFRLYNVDGEQLGNPPTCYTAVAYKMAERKSLHIEERRPSHTEKSTLNIYAMRDEHSGNIMDVVSRGIEISEIMPYRVDDAGRLKLYLHDGIARSIANAVPRAGINIDDRRWSGHMVEPITLGSEAFVEMEQFDAPHTTHFSKNYLGLEPVLNAILEHGPDYYPAPDYIDERIHTYYLSVQPATGEITPKSSIAAENFQAKGEIREVDAQQILNAIAVGMIPNARLELQILSLFQHLGIKAETWTDKHISLQASKIANQIEMGNLMRALQEEDKRFKTVSPHTGSLRPIHSIFVEEGQSEGGMTGLTSENIDFIIHDNKTINTAVLLPLKKDMKGEVHAGFNMNYLPVPQRHEGNGLTVSCPSFNIPPDVVNEKQIRKFVAEQFGVLPAMVIKLGESYFSHIGMTPHRIYPYAVSVPPYIPDPPETKFIPFYQMMLLQRLISKEPHFMLTIARAYRYFNDQLRFDAKKQVKAIVKQRFEGLQPDWSIPLNYEPLEFLKAQAPKISPEQVAKLKDSIKYAQNKASHEMPDEVEKPEFEAELEAFMDIVEADIKPEKW